MFLTDDYVCEVKIDSTNPKIVICTCKKHHRFFPCKHVKYIKSEMKKNNGQYSIEVSDEILDEDIYDTFTTSEGFRDFVIKHTPIGHL